MVNSLLCRVADALLPGRCRQCLANGIGGIDLCPACYRELPRLQDSCVRCAEPLHQTEAALCGRCLHEAPAFSRARIPFLYAPPVSAWIMALKYRNDLSAGRLLGRLLAQHLKRQAIAADLLVPVPLHDSRFVERGFNQAREISLAVCRHLGKPHDPTCLNRTRATSQQSALPRRERRSNVRKAFIADRCVAGLRVALLDDVLTTGSTADAAADALLRAGARDVEIWAVARTLKR